MEHIKQNALPNAVANGGFNPEDLTDAKSLLKVIASGTSPLHMHLVKRLTAAQLLPLPEYIAQEPDRFCSAVCDELNRIIGGDSLAQDAYLQGIRLSQTSRKLLRKSVTGPELVKLNKFILLDGFPGLLQRRPGRGRNLVQQTAVVLKLSDSFAVTVTLVEPRMLLGKLREGRVKFERKTAELANALCNELNNELLGQKLARQLSPEETRLAKHLFWSILEPKHPDWINHLDAVVEHCERTSFRIRSAAIPKVSAAAKIFWQEHLSKRTKETRMNYRNFFGFLLPVFGTLHPWQVTDAMLRKYAYGSEPVQFFATSHKQKQTPEAAEARLWDTPTASDSKRPWDYYMVFRFLTCARKFWNWMARSVDPATQEVRDWCPPSELKTPKPVRTEIQPASPGDPDPEVTNNPALTPEQVQAVIDVAWVAYGGHFAPFYVHTFWGGTRVKETRLTDETALDVLDAQLTVPASVDKTKRGRDVQIYPTMLIMVEALKVAGLYITGGFQANQDARAVIQILAGFTSGSKRRIALAEAQREKLEKLGYKLPKYNWGIPFPRNAMRRTALSMHYKLFRDEKITTLWGGNTPGIFKEFYKRLVTPEQAEVYWRILPRWLKETITIAVPLPSGHKLNRALPPEVVQGITEARQAMKQFAAAAEAAKANAAEQRLEMRRAKARDRARLMSKRRKAAAKVPEAEAKNVVPLVTPEPETSPNEEAA